jgi:hypothetical protein
MRMRRPFVKLAVVLLLAGAGALLLTAHGPRPRLTAENYGRIRPGMTLAEVEAILGAPPGDYIGVLES